MAATTADRVVTELIADTSGHDPKIRTSAQVVDQAASTIERSANRAEAAVVRSSRNQVQAFTQSAGAARAGAQQLSFQIGDVAQQLALGTNITTIFAQQGGQVIQAITLMKGSASGFLGFLAGPWGAVITGAGIVLASLVPHLLDTRTELEKATDDLEENARKAELTRQAQEAFARTIPGVIAAIRSESEALREQNRTLEENQRLSTNAAGKRYNDALNARDRTRRELERRRAETGGDIVRIVDIARLTAQLQVLDQEIARAERDATEALIPEARRGAEEAVDPIRRLTAEYERRARAAETAATATDRMTAAQRRAAHAAAAVLQQTLTGIYRERDAAIAAERERQAAARRTERDLVRPVTGAILSPFGADRSGVPLNGRRVAGRRHEGVDLRGNIGDPVVAPEGGVATVRNAPGGLGLYVEIRADSGARNLLAHLSAANVRTGQRVEAGQLVGLVGNSGNARGGTPHLHYQRQVNGRWVDPMRSIGSSGAAQQAQAAAREAAQLAETRAREEAQFQQRLGALNADLLEARRGQVLTAEQATALEIQQIEAERDLRNQAFRQEAADNTRRDAAQEALYRARAEQLVNVNNQIAAERVAHVRHRAQQQLDEERYRIAVGELNDAQQIEQARGQLARTTDQRRASELRLLELQRQEELAAIDRQLAAEGLTAAMRQRLQDARASVNQRFDMATQLTQQRNMTPLQQFLDRAPSSAEELNEALEGVAVGGLASLNDGLAQAVTNFIGLGGTAGRIINQMIADLVRLLAYRYITAPLASAIGGAGSGGGILGALGGLFGVKTADAGWAASFAGLPGKASGYVGSIGGLGGMDRNILSINGVPRARVSGSETLAIIPAGKMLGYSGGRAIGGGGGGPAPVIVNIDARDAVLTHQVRSWVREGIEEASARGAAGGATYVAKRSMQRTRQTL